MSLCPGRRAAALLCLCLGLGALAHPGRALAQACVTCRAERCPQKPGLRDWCGAGKDSMAKGSKGKKGGGKAGGAPGKDALVEGIRVTTTPPGASVTIDDGSIEVPGVTPLADLRLARGRHTLRFTLEGYEPAALQVEVSKKGQAFLAELSRAPGAAPGAGGAAAPALPVASASAAPVAPSTPAGTAAAQTRAATETSAPPTRVATAAQTTQTRIAMTTPVGQRAAPGEPPGPPSLQPPARLTTSTESSTNEAARPELVQTEEPARTPVYKRWWFWTAIGGGVAAAVLVGVLAAQPWAPPKPGEIVDLRGRL